MTNISLGSGTMRMVDMRTGHDNQSNHREQRIQSTLSGMMCCSSLGDAVVEHDPKSAHVQTNDTTANEIEATIHSQISDDTIKGEDVNKAKLPSFECWRHRPLLLTSGPGTTCKEGLDPYNLPIGEEIPFETEMFQGKFLMRIRNAPNTPDQQYFSGKKRTKQMVVQGRFKKQMSCDDIYIGDKYEKPLQIFPLVKLAIPIFRKLVPGISIDLSSDKQKILMLMGGESRTISIDLPGEEPDMRGDLTENIERMGNFKSIVKRRKMLRQPKLASKYFYDPKYVYTFQFYDDIIDITNHTINLPVGKISLFRFLNRQPMTFAVTTADEKELFSFKFYHEKSVENS